jgi:hypothetical protein
MVPGEGFRSTNVREEEKLFRKTQHHLTPNRVLLPFTVTNPITNQEISKAVDSRDAELAFQAIMVLTHDAGR